MKLLILTSFLYALNCRVVYAAVIPSGALLPFSAEPGLVQKRLTSKMIPAYKTTALPEAAKLAKIAPADSKIKFVLNKIILEGNTVFSESQLRELYQSSLRKTISVAELQGIVQKITKKYRDEGFIISRALLPPQTIKQGIVRIQIVEGFISKVEVKGDPGKAECVIAGYGKHILDNRPLQMKILERYVLLANDLPGYTVKAVLTPSKTVTASSDLTLVVERKKSSAYLSEDNFGTRYLGPQQITGSLSLYSILVGGENNTFKLLKSTQGRELRFFEYLHAQPVGTRGAKWIVVYDYTKTRPGFILQPLNIIGRSTWIFTDIIYPVIRSRERNLVVHGQANYQNVFSTISEFPFYQDRIRSLATGAFYESADKHKGVNTAGIDFTQGLNVMGAHQHLNQSRPLGNTEYLRTNIFLGRLQGVTERFSIYVSMRGQYASKPLLASEQFSYGGSDFGRGYDPSEIVGDKGVAAKLELRIQTNPEKKFLKSVQYYMFYDAGKVYNLDRVNLPPNLSATSAGVGARFIFIPYLTGQFFIAKPLTLPVATLVLQGKNGNQFRTFFQVIASY